MIKIRLISLSFTSFLQIAHHKGIIEINWNKVNRTVNNAKNQVAKDADRMLPHLIEEVSNHLNPLRAKFLNINMYLQFLSFLHTDMAQVVGILLHVRQGLAYLPISWLLMTHQLLLCGAPDHHL